MPKYGQNARLSIVEKTDTQSTSGALYPDDPSSVVAEVCARVFEYSETPQEMKSYGKETENMLMAGNVDYDPDIREHQYVTIAPLKPGNMNCPGQSKLFEIVRVTTHLDLKGCPNHMSLKLSEVCDISDDWKHLLPDPC